MVTYCITYHRLSITQQTHRRLSGGEERRLGMQLGVQFAVLLYMLCFIAGNHHKVPKVESWSCFLLQPVCSGTPAFQWSITGTLTATRLTHPLMCEEHKALRYPNGSYVECLI